MTTPTEREALLLKEMRHIAGISNGQAKRVADAVLAQCADALKLAVRQNGHDILMTGDELRTCDKAVAALEAEIAQGVEPVGMRINDPLIGNPVVWWREVLPGARLYTAAPEPVNAWIAVGDGLPDIGTPVMAMCGLTTPEMYPMMRGDAGGDEWLWEAYRSGPIDDSRSYEDDDDYEVVAWMPLPKKHGATT